MAVIAAAAILQAAGAKLFVTVVVLAAAAYVDATYVVPMFMDEPKSSASFGSWDVTYAEEGSPMKWAYGEQNRIAGQVIVAGRPWATQSGGGGGKRAEPVCFTYWVDVIFAITANQFYRVDRLDFEGNTSYVRDVSTTVSTSWALSLVRFHYAFGDEESTVAFQRTGNVGASNEWSLVQWHGTISNMLPYEFQQLGHFMPGERLKVTGATSFSNAPSIPNPGGSNSLSTSASGNRIYRARWPGSNFYVRLPMVWENLVCVSSRNYGHVSVLNALGQQQSVARTKLVIDFLGEVNSHGILREIQFQPTFPPTGSPFWQAHGSRFGQGISTAERDAFLANANGYSSPLSYVPNSGANGWPRSLGVGQQVTIEYQDPRNWALDVLRNNNPTFGTDYQERPGGVQTSIDPIYEAQVGSEEVPALPQLGYFSLANLNLSRFGNRIPQAHFYVDARERGTNPANNQVTEFTLTTTNDPKGPTYSAIRTGAIEVLCKRHGGLNSTFDFSTKRCSSAQTLQGLSFGGLHEVMPLVNAICMVGDLTPQEHSNKIHFFTRDQRHVVNLSWHQLDARQFGSPPSPMLALEDQDVRAMPRRLHLRFQDVDKDMQAGDVYAYRDSSPNQWVENGASAAAETRRVKIPDVVLSDDQARPIAERMLADMQNSRQRVRLRLSAWFQNVCEGDVLKMADYEITPGHRGQTNPITGSTKYQNRDWWIVVEQVDIGADFFVELEGVVWPEDPREWNTAASTALVGAGYGNTGEDGPARMRDFEIKDKLEYNAPSVLVAVDVPPVQDAHAGKTGIYFAYTAPGAFRDQPSGVLAEDVGDGDSFIALGQANSSAIMGRVKGVLPSGPVNVQTQAHNFQIELLSTDYASGGLASTDDAGLAKGYNFACVGSPGAWEIIQFKTVAEESGASYSGERYRISGLRRGLRGSERYVDTHRPGEWFILLDHRRLHFHEIDSELVGLTRRYKVDHSTEGSSTAAEITVQGWTALPLPVAQLVAWRKSNGDVVFTWNRRTRARYRTLGTQQAPLMEGTESYDVVIDLSSDRTINVTDTTTATYTAAQQAEDSTSGQEITVTVYQRDSARGRGQPREMIVAQTQAEVGTEDGNVLGTEDTHTLNTPMGGGMD